MDRSLHHTSDAICPLCESKLMQAHPDIASWYREKKKLYPNLHISFSYRTMKEQNELFAQGKTLLQWPNSKHNNQLPNGLPCALALDLFQIDEDGNGRFSRQFYSLLNDQNRADRAPIRWGGDFKSLKDYDHFELITV